MTPQRTFGAPEEETLKFDLPQNTTPGPLDPSVFLLFSLLHEFMSQQMQLSGFWTMILSSTLRISKTRGFLDHKV